MAWRSILLPEVRSSSGYSFDQGQYYLYLALDVGFHVESEAIWEDEWKENFKFKPVKLRLKIDLVLYPARAEGLVNIYIYHSNNMVDEYLVFINMNIICPQIDTQTLKFSYWANDVDTKHARFQISAGVNWFMVQFFSQTVSNWL